MFSNTPGCTKIKVVQGILRTQGPDWTPGCRIFNETLQIYEQFSPPQHQLFGWFQAGSQSPLYISASITVSTKVDGECIYNGVICAVKMEELEALDPWKVCGGYTGPLPANTRGLYVFLCAPPPGDLRGQSRFWRVFGVGSFPL